MAAVVLVALVQVWRLPVLCMRLLLLLALLLVAAGSSRGPALRSLATAWAYRVEGSW